MKFLVFLLPVLLCASNLKDFIELSTQNEQYLIEELKSLQASKEEEKITKSYYPNLSLNSGYISNHKDRLIIDPKESLFAQFSLNFLLLDGGERSANIKTFEHKSKLAKLRGEQSKNYLALSASALFFNYQSLEKIIQAKKQQSLYLENTLSRLEKFHEAGLSAKDELESIRAKYHLSLLELSQNELKLLQIQKEIKQLLKKDLIPQGFANIKEPQNIKSQNLELAMAKEQISISQEQVNAAKSLYFPKISLQNNFMLYQNNYEPKIPRPYKDMAQMLIEESGQSNQIMLVLEWKLFDFGARKQNLESKRLEVQMQNLNLNYLERKNTLELDYLNQNLKVLKQQIWALNSALNAAQIAFESIDQKYSSGLCTYIEYLGALQTLFKAQSDLEFAKMNLKLLRRIIILPLVLILKQR